jgi:cation:H+ antiporter
MILHLVILALGVGALYYGAEWLVKGSARLGMALGWSPIVIGLTVVSLGTSAPELVVCVAAALRGNGDLAVGNVIGSNLANIGLVLGLTGAIMPLQVAGRVVRREVPVMIIITLLVYPLLLDLTVGRLEGFALLVLLVGYLYYVMRESGSEAPEIVAEFEQVIAMGEGESSLEPGEEAPKVPGGGRRAVTFVVVGVVALTVGGELIVRSAIEVADWLGMSDLFVGLTVVAIGTSLPELATSVVAAIRRQSDIAVGNIIGSNIFNLTAVLGISSLVQPLHIDASVLTQEYPAMLVLSLLVLPIARMGFRIRRFEGMLLLVGYFGIFWWFFL